MIHPPLQGEGDRGAQRRGGGAPTTRVPPSVERARKLRREMSYPEVLLWQRLRGSPDGLRFRRQHPIGPDYTADFYCLAARLVIEVDGQMHGIGAAPRYDARRDAYMRSRGLEIVRIPAVEVLRNTEAAAAGVFALATSRADCDGRPSTTPLARRDPPPRAGEEQGS